VRTKSGDFYFLALGFGDDDPEDEIGDQPWQPAGEQQDEKEQAKPESGDPEEFTQTPADAGDDPVMAGSA
jgi:hypothetical protein